MEAADLIKASIADQICELNRRYGLVFDDLGIIVDPPSVPPISRIEGVERHLQAG